MKQTFMEPEELQTIGKALFPHGGWQKQLAVAIGRNETTMSRWVNGLTPIEQPVAMLLLVLYTLQNQGKDWQDMVVRAQEKLRRDRQKKTMKMISVEEMFT